MRINSDVESVIEFVRFQDRVRREVRKDRVDELGREVEDTEGGYDDRRR